MSNNTHTRDFNYKIKEVNFVRDPGKWKIEMELRLSVFLN